jgi:small subunit ribosomal protein S6
MARASPSWSPKTIRLQLFPDNSTPSWNQRSSTQQSQNVIRIDSDSMYDVRPQLPCLTTLGSTAKYRRSKRVRHSSTLLTTTPNRTISIAKTAGKLILTNNGVIRGITNWGVFALPKPVPNRSGTQNPNDASPSTSSQPGVMQQYRSPKHTVGHYFVMRFDASARTQHLLRKTWNSDPRLLRFSVVKVGDKLEDICDVGGRAEEWDGVEGSEGSVAGEGMMTAGDIGAGERDIIGSLLREERAMGKRSNALGTNGGRAGVLRYSN